jgi:DNA-directed RNA polymerase sigma subunit (sigma70/sigma32)
VKPLAVDFEDIGGPEALELATQAPEPGPMERVYDSLVDAGMSPATAFLTSQRIEKIVEGYSFELAAEGLRHLASGLTGTASAVALRRALIGSDHTLADDAATVGVTRQRIHALERKTKTRLAALIGEGS